MVSRTLKKAGAALRSDEGKKQGERFGMGVALATAVMAAIAMYRGLMERMEILALISATLLALSLILPRALYPLAWLLESAFKTVTKTTMYVLLAFIFYLIFAPVGLILRILDKDILQQKIDPEAASYWTPRKPTDPSRAEKQF
jgi:hypothetical protein